jgi:hypothetical protein
MIKKGKYDCIIEDNVLTLKRNGKDFLSLPASASVNKVFSRFTRQTTDENTIRFSSDFETMTFDLYDDCIIVRYEKSMVCILPFLQDSNIGIFQPYFIIFYSFSFVNEDTEDL